LENKKVTIQPMGVLAGKNQVIGGYFLVIGGLQSSNAVLQSTE
jgi:hypothetical protein